MTNLIRKALFLIIVLALAEPLYLFKKKKFNVYCMKLISLSQCFVGIHNSY